MLLRLSNFDNKHKTFTSSQYGILPSRSTELALFTQKEFLLQARENQNVALAPLIDFTKAFDSLSHHNLFDKLEAYGYRGHALHLIKSYLSQCRQYVQNNLSNSGIKPIMYRVPQGSILIPFLFNIYINDIVLVTPQSKSIIYADDTTLLFSGPNNSN